MEWIKNSMERDWEAVASAIRDRMAELDLTQNEVAQRAGVALMTIRELQHNLKSRRRSPRTIAAVAAALDWPENHLMTVLVARDPEDTVSMSDRLARIEARLDALERRPQ